MDNSGYVTVETQRYSVPENLIGKQMNVYKYEDRVEIYQKTKCVATHTRLIGQRYQRNTLPGHHKKIYRQQRQQLACDAEKQLRDEGIKVFNDYLDELKKKVRGRGVRQHQRLLDMMRTYPKEALIKAIEQAHQYGLYDLNRLEELILKYIGGEFFDLGDDR